MMVRRIIAGVVLLVVVVPATPTNAFAPSLHHQRRPRVGWVSRQQRCPASRTSSADDAPTTTTTAAASTTTTTPDSHSRSRKSKEERFVEWMTTDCWDEVPHPGRQLTVQGHIPAYVQGTYIKNGPGAFATRNSSSPQQRYTHAFDGLAKLQKFDVDGARGTVAFQDT